MHLNKSNIIYNLIFVLTTILILCTVSYLTRNCVFYGDDLGYTVYTNLIGCIQINSGIDAFSNHSGGYLCLILTRFFNYDLACLLNMHPADFMGFPSNLIKGIFFAIIVYLTANFSKNYVKSKPLFLSFYLLSFSYFTYSIMDCDSYIFTVTHSFYRYIFPLLFYLVFIDFLYKNLFKVEQSKISKILFLSIVSFFLGTSVELIFFSLSAFVCLLFLYNIMVFYINKIKNKNIELFCFNKPVIFVIITFLLSTISFVFSRGFKTVASDRGLENIKLSVETIKEFTSMFYQMDILRIWWLWIIGFVIFIFTIYICKKNNKINELIFPLLLQISNILVLFSLVLCGKTYDFADSFWLMQPNVQSLFRILLFIPFLMMFNLVYRFTEEKFKKNSLVMICSLLGIIFICLSIGVQKENYNNGKAYFSPKIKKMNYIVEKMYRFFYLSKKEIHLPTSLMQLNRHLLMCFHWSRDFKYIDDKNYGKWSALSYHYYPLIYKDTGTKELEYYYSEDAINKFYSAGGCITKEEINNIKFNKLKDEKFIFKKNINCIPPTEIESILRI